VVELAGKRPPIRSVLLSVKDMEDGALVQGEAEKSVET